MTRATITSLCAAVGLVFGLAVPAVASWLVSTQGEANVKLASLSALKVGTAHGDGEALPGRQVALVADVENPNEISLTIISSSLQNIQAEGCDVSDVKYLDRSDVSVEPGKHENVVLGRLVLPDRLGNACQGASITAALTVRAAYGS
jgi:hypothetical protein